MRFKPLSGRYFSNSAIFSITPHQRYRWKELETLIIFHRYNISWIVLSADLLMNYVPNNILTILCSLWLRVLDPSNSIDFFEFLALGYNATPRVSFDRSRRADPFWSLPLGLNPCIRWVLEELCFKPSLNIHKEIYENCAQNLFRFTGLKLCQ